MITFGKKKQKELTGVKEFTKIKNVKYSKEDVHINWFEDGELNVSYNCVDRHVEKNPDNIAIIWEGDDPKDTKKLHIKNYLLMFVKRQMF